MSEVHEHKWESDGFVLDFGRYGIRVRTCAVCGETQESDPFQKASWHIIAPQQGSLVPA